MYINFTPHENAGGCIDTVAPSSLSLALLPHPRTVVRDGSWGSCDRGWWQPSSSSSSPRRRSVVVSLPVVAVVVGVPVSSPGNAAPSLQPAHIARSGGWLLSSCPSTRDPTPLTVASSGRGVVCLSLSFLSCTPFPPREQLLAAAVRDAVVVSAQSRCLSSRCLPCEYSPCCQKVVVT